MGSFGFKGILIFDSNPNHARDYPTKSRLNHLEIAHAPINLEGDLYILEYLSALKNKPQVRLITSDRELSAHAKNLQIKTISCSEFYSHLTELAQKSEAIKNDLKPHRDSKQEIERLEKIFESNSKKL